MDVYITHIFHNCFVLDVGDTSYVFDIPAERFRTKKTMKALRSAIEGKNVTAFFTHSHLDHFAPDYQEICDVAASLKAVISDDIEEMYPDLSLTGTLVVEPDEKYSFNGLAIETMMSNDLGVAYIFSTPERLSVYNGGDLACWDWETSSLAERSFTRNFYNDALRKVASSKVQIAFSNVDRRLDNLAGGPLFVKKVRPQVFVPTHAFGRTEWLLGIHEQLGLEKQSCFEYRRPGDKGLFKIEL